MLPAPSIAQLAEFTGRDADGYAPFAGSALDQAALLFTVVTKLDALPDDPAQASLATNAILEMADRLYLEQRYAETLASPFQSETIGTYSYSKSSTVSKARTGNATGLLWWDLAIDLLSQAGTSVAASGSVGGGFDADLGYDSHGHRGITDPTNGEDLPPYVRIS